MLALLAAGTRAQTTRKAKPLPAVGEFVPFLDPTTETRVVRLTSPAHTSWLPAASNRFVSVKNRFLVFSSDRNGPAAPFELDLHAGLARPLAETSALVPRSLCLDEKQRLLWAIDGGVLKEITLSNHRARTVAEDIDAFAPVSGEDFMVIRRGRLELLNAAKPIAQSVAPFCLLQPGGRACLFLRQTAPAERDSWEEREYWLAALDEPSKPLLLAKGRVSDPFWAPGGRSLLFLRQVPGPAGLFSEIHEVAADGTAERCIAPTSQFAAFAPNADASVFVGASRSKAQPTIILLLRSAKRELTLCEHRATQPSAASPVFSPDSRRVYFESDHEGKPALYSVNVEALVEPTAGNS
jgi:oligogalacturonide lyase